MPGRRAREGAERPAEVLRFVVDWRLGGTVLETPRSKAS